MRYELRWTCGVLAALLLWTAAFVGNSAFAATTSWWNASYPYRYKISITATGSAIASGYSVSTDDFDHAAEVSGGRSLTSGNDVRFVYWNGTAWTELDRVVDPQSAWNTAAPQIWFRTQAAIAANATDDNYYLYYGNVGSAGTPPADESDVFLFFDGFAGNSLSSSRWSSDDASVSGGILTLPVDAYAFSTSTFGVDTIWETRVRMPDPLPNGGSQFFYYWMAANNNGSMGFFANTTDHYAITTTNATTQTAINEGTATGYQIFSFTREGNTEARFRVNGAQVAAITTNLPTGNLQIAALNDANGSRTQQYDWVRVRAYRDPEPAPVLGTLEQPAPPSPVAEWRLDEASWSAAAGQVVNSSSNAMHGQAMNGATTRNASPTPARSANPGTCGYGSFDGSNDFVQVADNAALDMTSQVTVSAWVYPLSYGSELRSIVSKDANYEVHLNSSGQVYWWWGGGSQQLTSSTSVPLNTWTHIAISYQSGAQRIYINGVLRASGSVSGSLTPNSLPLQIGQDQVYAGRYWHGYIDEVRVYSSALTAGHIQTVYQATHPCSTNASRFVITHDGAGVNCAAEAITVNVRDSNNNAVTTYSQQITLNTQTGRGTWSRVTGGGTFADATANDGLATYQWPSGESSAVFSLSYPEGTRVFDIDAYQTSDTSIRDDDSEGNMTFADSMFVITSAQLASNQDPPFPTLQSPQTAGTSFPVHIAKYGSTLNNPSCRIVTDYQGTKPISIWRTYVNPSSGSLPLSITAGSTTANAGASAGASAFNINFANGRAEISALYKDVGLISFSVRDEYEAALSPQAITTGGSGNFVVKPAYFSVVATGNPGAADATGTIFRTAGDAFALTVTARDSAGAATPNYGRESPSESVQLVHAAAHADAVSNGTLSGTLSAFSGGVATSSNFMWSEVGILTLTGRIADGDYLAAGNITGVPSGNIGRFVPADFLVTQQTGALGPSCGTFSYLGQPLKYSPSLGLLVTARNRQGATTTNYRQSFFKLSNSSVTGRAYSLLDNTALTHANAPANEWNINALNDGTGTLTFTTGSGVDDGLVIAKSAPRAPFDAQIQLKFELTDADGVLANEVPVTIGAGSGIPFNSPQQRYGRLAFRSAIGSERLNLPMPLRVEYYFNDALGFRTSTDGTCSIDPTVGFSEYGGNLQAGETSVASMTSPPAQGDFALILRAPGTGNDGKVKVQATVPAWLQIWNASTSTLTDPWGIATFGIYQGSSKRVYQREVYSGSP